LRRVNRTHGPLVCPDPASDYPRYWGISSRFSLLGNDLLCSLRYWGMTSRSQSLQKIHRLILSKVLQSTAGAHVVVGYPEDSIDWTGMLKCSSEQASELEEAEA